MIFKTIIILQRKPKEGGGENVEIKFKIREAEKLGYSGSTIKGNFPRGGVGNPLQACLYPREHLLHFRPNDLHHFLFPAQKFPVQPNRRH
jgi:hypothetical protein